MQRYADDITERALRGAIDPVLCRVCLRVSSCSLGAQYTSGRRNLSFDLYSFSSVRFYLLPPLLPFLIFPSGHPASRIMQCSLVSGDSFTVTIQVLNTPYLWQGEPGVGKSAVIEGLALRIVDRGRKNLVPQNLNGRIFSLDLGRLIAGTTCHGQYEEVSQ